MISKLNKFNILFIAIILFGFLIFSGCNFKQKNMNKEVKNFSEAKKIVMIIAFQGFQDIEYANTRAEIEKRGYDITVVSSSLGEATGKFGKRVAVDNLLNEVSVDEYDAVVFIGGPGAAEYIDNGTAHNLAKEAIKKNKVLAAICIAPDILAKAGVLKGKKATVWSSIIDRRPIKILEDNGAIYVDRPVVVDGKIITANGPSAAKEFGETITKLLSNNL